MTVRTQKIFTVDPTHSIPLYAQLVDQISHRILGGELLPGDSLPSVRHLAESLEINSLTVQKTYKILENEGLIEIRKGIGAFVSDNVPSLSGKQKDKLLQKECETPVRLARSLGMAKENFIKVVEELWEKIQ